MAYSSVSMQEYSNNARTLDNGRFMFLTECSRRINSKFNRMDSDVDYMKTKCVTMKNMKSVLQTSTMKIINVIINLEVIRVKPVRI